MFESIYISIFLAGFLGGLIRGLIGFIKHQLSYKNVTFHFWYFLSMMTVSGIVGLLTIMVVKDLGIGFMGLDPSTPALAFVVGYAGGDFLENIYKTIIKKPSLYSFPEELLNK